MAHLLSAVQDRALAHLGVLLLAREAETRLHSYGLYRSRLHSYGLHSYGLHSHGIHSYGLYSCGPRGRDAPMYSHGLYSYGPPM